MGVDPAECVHPAFDRSGGLDDEGDVFYVGATCTECGAAASAVHPLTHYLVFEEDGAEPVEVRAEEGGREALVTFTPHVGARMQTGTYLVPLEDATVDGQLAEGDSTDALKDHPNAPEWVREWDGQFDVDVSEVR